MTSHKHSFQCFDAVVDKPSITVGHNFALPHKSSFNLEQLEKHRCSLCSESQQGKLVTSEVSGNQSASWHQPQSPSHQHTPKRPMRPEGDPVYGVAHRHHNHHHQYYTRGHCKRIVLVKNSNPSIQKTILLHRKPVHSLGDFMDDVSELMQCLIRKLYTLDGRKVDSVQSLLQGPGVLVCVGREAFHPLLLDNIQKNSEDKLPKLILKSQSSTCNEDEGYKKNVNFGVKSKKRVPPGPFPNARENMMDDDIEKRVLVNKDGSLSMEMKVHFRLLNDETLHCSTEIKKSSCTFNVSFPGQDNGYYPHCANGESCSESLYASEGDDVCIKKLCQKHMKESHCQHCSTCCQEYNIWKNPAFSEQESLRHIGSTSSSAQSRKIKCRRESADSVHTTSCEEYTEQVVEKSTCIQKIVGEGEKGDHTAQYCTMSRCCSRSEVCSVSTKAKTAGYTDEKHGQNESTHAFAEEERRPVPFENLKQDQMSAQITQVSIEDERPLSVETNSSDILASLKEDEDKEETDLSPSNSRASQSNKENAEQTRNPVVSLYSFTPCKPAESPKQSLSLRTSSTASCCSVKSKTSRKVVVKETQNDVDHDKNNTPSTTPPRCQHKESTVLAIENDTFEGAINQSEDAIDKNYVPDTETITEALKSDLSQTCDDFSDYNIIISQTTERGRSSAMSSQSNPHADLTIYSTYAEQVFVNMKEPNVRYASEEQNIEGTSHVTDPSESPEAKNKTEELAEVTYEEKVASSMSPKSNVSARSNRSRRSEAACKERAKVELQDGERAQSVISVHSSASTISEQSTVSELLANGSEDQTEEVIPCELSKISSSSQISDLEITDLREMEDQIDDRSPSIMSVQSNISEVTPVQLVKVQSAESLASALSTKTNISVQSIRSKISEGTPVDMDNRLLMERGPSAMSVKSDVSERSKTSNISDIGPHYSDIVGKAIEDRAPSAKSHKSNRSRSNTPKILTVPPKEADDVEEKGLKRPSSVMSSKSADSVPSTKSKLRDEKDDNNLQDSYITSVMTFQPSDEEPSKGSNTSKPTLDKSGDFEDNSEEQAPSIMSTKSNTPTEMLETSMGGKEERPISATSSKSSVSKRSEKCIFSQAAQECGHPDDRPASIMSSTSVKSKKSVVSVASLENAEDETKHTGRRSQNAMSVRSQRSRSRNSKASEVSRQGTSEESTEDLVKETESAYEETKNNRAASAMSSKSLMSTLCNMSKDQIQDRTPTPMSVKSNPSTKSKNSKMDQFKDEAKHERVSILASPKSNRSVSSKKSLAVVSPAEMGNQGTERTQSVMSGKSHTSKASKKDVVLDGYKEQGKANEEDLVRRSPSAVSDKSNPSVMQTADIRAKSPLTTETIDSDLSKKTECTHKNSSQPIADNEVTNNKCAKKKSMESSSRSLSSRSAHSDFGSSKPAVTDRPKSNTSNAMLHLELNGHKSNVNAKCNSVCERPKSNLSSDRYIEKEISRPHSADVLITSTDLLRQKSKEHVISLGVSNHHSSPSNKNDNKLNTTRDLNVCSGTCDGSLVATDCSKNVNDNQSEKNSNSCRNSSSSLAQKVDNNTDLVPSILPTSSPTEVVSEWLNKIPLDSALYDVGDEFQKNCEEEEPLTMAGKVMQNERRNKSEGDTDEAVLRPQYEQQGFKNNESNVGDMKPTAKDLATVENIHPCSIPEVPSSVQLMRILLSPKLDRCNSLPEISPVYGRKLSTSARGFLDSLVNLQLLDFDPNDVNGKAEKYKDLMNMLQSLWLFESNNEEFNVKASSEVDINSAFQGSGKTSVNESTVAPKSQTNTECEVLEILTKVHEIDKTDKAFKRIDTKSDPATPDIASRVRWTPENEAEENVQDSNIPSAGTASISNMSSGTDSNDNQNLTDHEEDTNSESLSSEQTAQFAEKVSQDPDPVWLLNLLTKIEKQFMTHYVTAMAEFKIRWNLNDNEQLDAMICELKDEVHKRIQASINNELRTIQTHAGRPRPPKETRSCESSIFTEKRHRHLKVHLNQSIDRASKSDADSTAVLKTDFNDQQNDDKYCPCDSCMKKKASPRSILALPVENSAPKMTDFDLRQILHLKIKVPSNSKENVTETEHREQHINVGNLAGNVLLESCKKERTEKLYKELHAESIEQKRLDTLNDKAFGKEYSQPVVGREPHGVIRGSSSSSLKEDATDTHLSKSELKSGQSMEESNNTSIDLEQESPITGGELRDHLELRNELEILETADADLTAEEKNAQSGPEDMKTGATITGDEVCDELTEGKQSVEGETVREEHAIDAETGKKDMAIKAGIVEEQEVAEGESTEGKETEAETSDETGDETILDKNESMTERTCEINEAAEGVVSESELEEGEEIPEDEKEKHEDGETETTWKNMLAKPDIAAEEESVEATEKEIATSATEERKIEINEDEKEAEHKSNGITHLENSTDEEDDIAEDMKSESTVNATDSAEDVSIKEISKESGGDNSFDEEKISEPAETGDITEHESVEGANPMNHESGKEEETDTDELDDEEKTIKVEAAEDEKLADSEVAKYSYDTDSSQVKTPEVGDVTTEDVETTGGKVVDVGEMAEDEADICYESVEVAETSKAQGAEDTSDDDTAEYGETPKATNTEDGEISDDDEGADAADTAEDTDRDDNEISEIEEMSCNQTVVGGITAKVKTTKYEETHDGTSEDGVVGADDEETAIAAEENGNDDDSDDDDDDDDDDERAEEIESTKTEGAEEIVNNEVGKDREQHTTKALKQFVGDEMNVENVQKAEDGQTVNGKTADAKSNGDTDTQMDMSENEEDDETVDDETDNGETADETTDDGETPNDNTADDGKAENEKPPESDMEEVNETEAETAEDGEQEDTEPADGQTGDDEVTDDEVENEVNDVAVEGKRAEDEETADNRTTEDGDTADEELSENEIAQNGEIAKGTIEEHVQTDDSESLENGETAGEVNGERHERTIASFNCTVKLYPSSEDGADADGEDSETEVHNKDGSIETEEDN